MKKAIYWVIYLGVFLAIIPVALFARLLNYLVVQSQYILVRFNPYQKDI